MAEGGSSAGAVPHAQKRLSSLLPAVQHYNDSCLQGTFSSIDVLF